MKNIIKISILSIALVLVLWGGAFLVQPANEVQGGFVIIPNITVATTSSAVSVTTSTRILATTTNSADPTNSYNRIYAIICNPNANPVYLNLDGDKPANFAAGRSTVVIATSTGYTTCYEITDRNPYVGSVTASSTNGTATTISVKEYVSQ